MKKTTYLLLLLAMSFTMAFAQEGTKEAKIVFKEIVHDFGKFPESDPYVTCVFEFTNEGNAPLIIHRALASCGCTVPTFPKEPIMPGKSGTITVSYNGKGRYPAPFKKSIRIMTNANPEVTILYVKGEMTAVGIENEKSLMDR